MSDRLSRRDALALGAISLGSLAFAPTGEPATAAAQGIGRVTTDWIRVYREPSFRADVMARVERDSLLTLVQAVRADDGPAYNPRWYQLSSGFVHSGYVQNVRWQPQIPVKSIAVGGQLFQVSVPLTRTYRRPDPASDPLYRLYYQSTAWVESVTDGTDGRKWYELIDDLLHVRYYARAEHLRPVSAKEIGPISPDVPLHQKRIEVSLARQELMAFEHGRLVLRTRVSTGIPDPRPRENGIPTITPSGNFYVDKKMPLRHMGDGKLTASLDAYELPGVPWVSYFHFTGVAFHGTYWHDNFGVPMSHGCVNMPAEEALWLFRWTQPQVKHDELLKIGHGTAVYVE